MEYRSLPVPCILRHVPHTCPLSRQDAVPQQEGTSKMVSLQKTKQTHGTVRVEVNLVQFPIWSYTCGWAFIYQLINTRRRRVSSSCCCGCLCCMLVELEPEPAVGHYNEWYAGRHVVIETWPKITTKLCIAFPTGGILHVRPYLDYPALGQRQHQQQWQSSSSVGQWGSQPTSGRARVLVFAVASKKVHYTMPS